MDATEISRNVFRWECLTNIAEDGIRGEVSHLKAFAELLYLSETNTESCLNNEDRVNAACLLKHLVDELDAKINAVVEYHTTAIKEEGQST